MLAVTTWFWLSLGTLILGILLLIAGMLGTLKSELSIFLTIPAYVMLIIGKIGMIVSGVVWVVQQFT